MKKKLSLRLSVFLTFLFIGIMIVTAYSMISKSFFIMGMDNIMSANLVTTATDYTNNIAFYSKQLVGEGSHSRTVKSDRDSFNVSNNWSDQPIEVKTLFEQPTEYDKLYKHVNSTLFSRPNTVVFLIKLRIDSEDIYVSKKATLANAPALLKNRFKASKQLLYTISFSIIFALALLIWLMLRRVSQPVSELAQWTHSLNVDTLSNPTPDFNYPELNEMAELIKNSLSSAQKSLEDQEQFLNFASHELRTPISIIRNNIELFSKLKQSDEAMTEAKFYPVIDRIDRASLTMKHLSETLLWLSRDNNEDLKNDTLLIDQIIQQSVEESAHLLQGKDTYLTISTQENKVIKQPEHPVKIVIGNLIRNSFQHTQQGDILIKQTGSTITISNKTDSIDDIKNTSSLGFGLGLQLTEKLAEKLNWTYQTSHSEGMYHVKLILNDE